MCGKLKAVVFFFIVHKKLHRRSTWRKKSGAFPFVGEKILKILKKGYKNSWQARGIVVRYRGSWETDLDLLGIMAEIMHNYKT